MSMNAGHDGCYFRSVIRSLVDDCNLVSDDIADYVQLSPSRVRWYKGQGQGLVIDRSQSPAHESGTVCLLRCER